MAAADAPTFSWDALPDRYRVILCDVWGVVHDGVRLLPGVTTRLSQWRQQGRFVLLVTNAPRPADAVERELDRLGLPRACRDAVVTSGEAGIEALKALGKPVGFIGTRSDRAVLEGRQLSISDHDVFKDLACTGLRDDEPIIKGYTAELIRWVERGVRLHCLNPDRLVIRGGVAEACAGALGDLYEELGGEVVWYGKPHAEIYRHAFHVAGDPPREAVLAVGDGLQTDMLGAARRGLDAIFVSGGIHRGNPFPAGFAAKHGLGGWQPIGIADGLS